MTRIRRVTNWVVAGAIVLFFVLLGYDIIPALTPGYGDTISEVIAEWAVDNPAIPGVIGYLSGHWFPPFVWRLTKFQGIAGAIVGVLFVLATTVFGWPPWAACVAGYVCGFLFWGIEPARGAGDYR